MGRDGGPPQPPALEILGVSKTFGQVPVLRDVSLAVHAGEVHALVGENGAGKSTLMKILMGVHHPDDGEYRIGGQRVSFASPADAQRSRVSMVYQEFGLIPYLDVTENILMGRLPTRWGRVRWSEARRQAAGLLAKLGSEIPPDAAVGQLKVADQQEVEIARALSYDPLAFIMDEPSSALSYVEMENLARLVHRLRDSGVAIVYITHKLEEVFALADRATVLRDGSLVATRPTSDLDMPTLVEMMTGRSLGHTVVRRDDRKRDEAGALLEVQGLTADGLFEDVGFTVTPGSVLAIAGLVGAGKSELARAIVGALPEGTRVSGEVSLAGSRIDVTTITPYRARELGIGFVSEDRQREGLTNGRSVLFNVVLPALRRVTVAKTLLAKAKALAVTRRVMNVIALRPQDPNKPVDLLSGGNQQKVVIGKWLAAETRLLILDEPTRGVDVGAREEIYALVRREAEERNLGILLLSSDLSEVLTAADDILVMVEGRMVRQVSASNTTEHELLAMVVATDDADGHGSPE